MGKNTAKNLWHHIQREKQILKEKLEAMEVKELIKSQIQLNIWLDWLTTSPLHTYN